MVKWYDRIGNRIEMKLYEDADSPEFEWVKGNVIKGYRYQDGIVTVVYYKFCQFFITHGADPVCIRYKISKRPI